MKPEKLIPLSKPNISEQDIQQVNDVLRSGMLVQGKNVSDLENRVQQKLKTNYCAALTSGTATLHLALEILGVGIGDEVIVPAFSYVATANVVELVGAKPVFIDITTEFFNIDETKIEEKITDKTKAIIVVHEFGLSANMEAIMSIATKHNLFVVEDAACALGAKFEDVFVGTIGHFGSFSLHPRKAVTSGEGGLLVTNDEKLDRQVRILRNHGISYETGQPDFVEAGYNYRMTDFQAALVKNHIAELDDIIEQRNSIAQDYFNGIKNNLVTLPSVPPYTRHTWQTFHVLLANNDLRNKAIDYFFQNNVQTNYGAQCIPEMTFYKKKYNLNSASEFPNALNAYKNGLALPMFELMNPENTEYIITLINKFK